MSRFDVPFDPTKSSRQNFMEWVGDDDRINELVRHCDDGGIKLRFVPGRDFCFVDVLNPKGNVISRGGCHSMVVNLEADRVTLFGSEDIAAGVAYIDRVLAGFDRKDRQDELNSLFRL